MALHNTHDSADQPHHHVPPRLTAAPNAADSTASDTTSADNTGPDDASNTTSSARTEKTTAAGSDQNSQAGSSNSSAASSLADHSIPASPDTIVVHPRRSTVKDIPRIDEGSGYPLDDAGFIIWPVIEIVGERRHRRKGVQYCVQWAPNPKTGEEYAPDWADARDVGTPVIQEWREKQRQ